MRVFVGLVGYSIAQVHRHKIYSYVLFPDREPRHIAIKIWPNIVLERVKYNKESGECEEQRKGLYKKSHDLYDICIFY